MDVTMLLCDAADEAGGKLYILGGGWSVLRQPNVPTPMALAIMISVPWDQSNLRHKLVVRLVTEDGDAVEVGDDQIRVDGELEVGRPPGLKPGTPLDAPVVLKFPLLVLGEGGYVWELEIDDAPVARTPFRVLGER
jgi:Family of unknown function (DUF6941)